MEHTMERVENEERLENVTFGMWLFISSEVKLLHGFLRHVHHHAQRPPGAVPSPPIELEDRFLQYFHPGRQQLVHVQRGERQQGRERAK